MLGSRANHVQLSYMYAKMSGLQLLLKNALRILEELLFKKYV